MTQKKKKVFTKAGRDLKKAITEKEFS